MNNEEKHKKINQLFKIGWESGVFYILDGKRTIETFTEETTWFAKPFSRPPEAAFNQVF